MMLKVIATPLISGGNVRLQGRVSHVKLRWESRRRPRVSQSGQFIRDEPIRPATRHFALAAPFSMSFEPLFEQTRAHELHHRVCETVAGAFGRIIVVSGREFAVKFARKHSEGRIRMPFVGSEFDPPFMASAWVSSGGIRKQRSNVETSNGNVGLAANTGECVGELLFNHVFAESAQLQAGSSHVDKSRRTGGDEPHHISDDIAYEPSGGCEHQHVVFIRLHPLKWNRKGS